MEPTERRRRSGGRAAGFTLVETLVAIVVLVFGLMAVTNLLLVAASSNAVANQATAAVTSAGRVMEMLKGVTFTSLTVGGADWNAGDGGRACASADFPTWFTEWHCTDDIPGVGRIHTHWRISTTADQRILHIEVQSQGLGTLAAARSRADFTVFRACTNSDPTTGGCPEAP
ncbi:MAG: prepilin-type N-terminal cleavage/methylation domain-containing protein [Vicinamibacteria bacterium]